MSKLESKEELYLLTLFMVVRNSKVLPKGLELGKSQKEINKMTYKTISELACMIDFDKAKEMFEEGQKAFQEEIKL